MRINVVDEFSFNYAHPRDDIPKIHYSIIMNNTNYAVSVNILQETALQNISN